jgi:N-acetylglucosaminyldiphosphoundecaprenol N-acetyl-beta-D-mannosaminyltransferase
MTMKLLTHLRFALAPASSFVPMGAAALRTPAPGSMASTPSHGVASGNRTLRASTEDLCGLQVLSTGLEQLARDIERQLEPGRPAACLACLNPHSHFLTLASPQFRQALLQADWLVPDGAGIILASRLTGGFLHRRITGADVFHRVCRMLQARGGMRVFFLGSSEDTLLRIRDRMRVDYPDVVFAGSYAPPFADGFSDADTNAMIEAVNAAHADVLWIGMTAPKQEVWINQHLARLDVRFAGAIGAVFDFYSGKVPRAPMLLQRFGLEWLLRLVQQPQRLWRRTFVSAPLFLLHVLAHRVRTRRMPAVGDGTVP